MESEDRSLCYNDVVRITIVGLGLIGGSLGLALRKSGWQAADITGHTRSQSSAATALKLGAVDKISAELQEAVKDSDIVILAVPVLAVRDILVKIAPVLRHGTIVTDTGSTKLQIMQWAGELLTSHVSFIGGHPMAGKEASGIEAADPSLFRGCMYCLTPKRGTAQETIDIIRDMVTAIGAFPIDIDPAEHDKLVAGISHLPMLLSVALVLATTRSPDWDKMSRLAASGYGDMTRLASGSPEMHADICLTNKHNIVSWLDRIVAELQELRFALSEDDTRIRMMLTLAREARQKWLRQRGSKN